MSSFLDVVLPRYFFLRRSFVGSVRSSLEIAVTCLHDQSPCLHTTVQRFPYEPGCAGRGSTSEGSSFFGLFTRWLIGHIFISSAGYGFSSSFRSPVAISPSHFA